MSDILPTLVLWSFSAFRSVAAHLKCILLSIIFQYLHMLNILTEGTFSSLCSPKPSLFFWCLSMHFFVLSFSNSFQVGSHPSKDKMISCTVVAHSPSEGPWTAQIREALYIYFWKCSICCAVVIPLKHYPLFLNELAICVLHSGWNILFYFFLTSPLLCCQPVLIEMFIKCGYWNIIA